MVNHRFWVLIGQQHNKYMESTDKTNEQCITSENVKKLLLEFYSKQENMNLIDYYSRTTFFDLIKKSRSETVHSAFLAWILEGSDFPNRGLSSNLMHFLQLLVSRKNNGQGDSDFDNGLKDAICTGTLELNDISIETEKPVQDFDSEANSKDRLDIYISCNTNLEKGKTLEIFIENKVGSKEGGPHDENSEKEYEKLNQTERYYSICSDNSKYQLFVYLTVLSKSKLDDFNNLDDKCKCNKYIQICYQDILERVLLPIKTIPNISSRTYNMIEEYISCLGIPAIDDDNNTSVKKQIIMAIPEEERERLRKFFETNQELLTMTLDVVALNKIYYSKINEEWNNINGVFEDSINNLLKNKNIEKLKIGNYQIIKKGGIINKQNMTRYDVRRGLIDYLNKNHGLGIKKIDSEIQSLLESFWERNTTLLLVALKVLSDDKDNDNRTYYEGCYKKLTSRDLSKFTIGDKDNLGKTDVVEKFVWHLLKNNTPKNCDPCEFINDYFKDVSKGPFENKIMISEENYNYIKEQDNNKRKDDKKQTFASDRYRKINNDDNETYYISTQWGGQYNSTVKTDNFPKLWKKIKEYNNDEKNKNKFNVEPTI